MREKFSKFAAMLLAAVMIVTGIGPVKVAKAAAKPQFTVKTSSSVVKPGEEVTVELWLGKGGDIVSFVGNIEYDTNTFEMVGKKGVNGPVTDECELPIFLVDPGSISALLTFSEPYNAGGLVYTITLKVKDNASGTGKIGFDFRGAQVGKDVENAEVIPAGNENVDVSVADKNGNAIAGGNVTINIPVQSISLNKTKAFTMARGTEDALTVISTPANALTGKKITWTSSNSKAVSVDANGDIKAVGVGKATVTAKVENKTASVDITVNAPLNSIQINKSTLTLRKGATESLNVAYDPEDTTDSKKVTWKSSNPSVATVDANGKVTALKDGVTDVTATVGTKTATCKVTVKEEPLTSISLNKTEISLVKNTTQKLEVVYNPTDTTDDKTVTWSTADATVATVKDGVVTALKEGETTITAKVGKHVATCKVKVAEIHLTGIVLDKATPTEMYKGQSHQLKFTLEPANTTDTPNFTFATSDPEIATVDANGKVTALKEGTVEIVVMTGDGSVRTSYTLTVKEIPLESISFKEEVTSLEVGKRVQLSVLFNPEDTTDAKDVVWSSSDESVATVNKGVLKALKAGKTVITAKVGEKEISFELTVTAKKTDDKDDNKPDNKPGNKPNNKPNKPAESETVQTGDTANIFPAMLTMLLSLSVIVLIVFCKNRKKRVIR